MSQPLIKSLLTVGKLSMVMCTYNPSRTRDRPGESGVKKEGRTKTSEKKGQEKTKMRPLYLTLFPIISPLAP